MSNDFTFPDKENSVEDYLKNKVKALGGKAKVAEWESATKSKLPKKAPKKK